MTKKQLNKRIDEAVKTPDNYMVMWKQYVIFCMDKNGNDYESLQIMLLPIEVAIDRQRYLNGKRYSSNKTLLSNFVKSINGKILKILQTD